MIPTRTRTRDEFRGSRGATASPWPWLLFVITPIALSLPWVSRIEPALDATLASVGLALSGIALGVATSDRFRPMLAFSSAFSLCWLAVPAIYQLAHQVAAWSDSQVLKSGENVTLALALHIVTTLSLLGGYLFWRARNKSRDVLPVLSAAPLGADVDTGTGSSREAGLNPWVRAIALGLVLLAVAMLPYVANMRGGFGVLFLGRDVQAEFLDASLDVTTQGGVRRAIVQFFPVSFAVAGSLLLVADARATGWRHLRFTTLVGIILGATMAWVYANPIANTRFMALAMLGSIALALVHVVKRRYGVLLSLAFVSLVLFLYPLVRYISNERGPGRTLEAVEEDRFSALATLDFDGFQQVINAFEFVQERGHSLGVYITSSVFVFVPRSIWSSKARPASLDVAENHGYSFINLSLPANAEIYIEFGWLGVILGFFLVGLFFAKMDNVWAKGTLVAQSAVAFTALAVVGVMRGPLGAQVPVVIFVALILLAVQMIMYRRTGRRQALTPG